MGDWKRTSLASKMVKQSTKGASHDSATPNVRVETPLVSYHAIHCASFCWGFRRYCCCCCCRTWYATNSLNSTILDSRQHRPESPSNSQEYPTLLANKIELTIKFQTTNRPLFSFTFRRKPKDFAGRAAFRFGTCTEMKPLVHDDDDRLLCCCAVG